MRDAVTWIIHPTQAQVMLKTLGVWRERKKKYHQHRFSLSWFCSAGGAENGVWPLQQVGISGDLRCGFYSTAAVLGKCPRT